MAYEPGRDDRPLSEIEQGQGGLAPDGGALIGAKRGIVALRLVLLVGEILDGFEIQHAVDGLGVGLGVAVVHLAPEAHPPIGDRKREADIEHDRHQGDRGKGPIEEPPQDPADQQDLEQGRHDVEQHEGQKKIDARGAALDRPRQPAGAALEVIAQRQSVDMAERGQRQPAHGALADLGEDGVAQLVEALRHHPGEPVGDDQGDRNGDQRRCLVQERRPRACRAAARRC